MPSVNSNVCVESHGVLFAPVLVGVVRMLVRRIPNIVGVSRSSVR